MVDVEQPGGDRSRRASVTERRRSISKELLDEKKGQTGWDVFWFNAQLYSIFSECATGKLKNIVMAREKEEWRQPVKIRTPFRMWGKRQ